LLTTCAGFPGLSCPRDSKNREKVLKRSSDSPDSPNKGTIKKPLPKNDPYEETDNFHSLYEKVSLCTVCSNLLVVENIVDLHKFDHVCRYRMHLTITNARIAQLAEPDLAKVGLAGSSSVSRSKST
jgi:hypothetical protein